MMTKELMTMNTKNLKILLSLFVLNSVTLYLYFFFCPDHILYKLTESRVPAQSSGAVDSKPWPILQSYMPWSDNKNAPLGSCEAYFGNGFTTRVDALNVSSSGSHRKFNSARRRRGGWFRCFYSGTLQSSVCEGGRIRMNVDRINMSGGGEELAAVIGRREEEELPEFEDGAFEIEVLETSRTGEKLVDDVFLENYVPDGAIDRHTMRALIDSIRLVGSNEFECSEWVEEPTLLVTRFEYANIFHTVTDWYSAYVASRVTGLPRRPHLVFLDGHCETPLEETWKALFSSLRYAKSFTGHVCFRHAILAPLGYETPLFKGLSEDIDCYGTSANELRQHPNDKTTARLSEFGEMIRAAFGFPVNNHLPEKPASEHNILFVRREDYLAHPRHGGKVQSRLNNEQEVFDSIQKWASNYWKCKLNIVNGLLAHMSMKEQIRAIQDASVISGAHGAGLTHTIAATPEAVVFEIVSSEFRRPHFALIAKWKGLEYHALYLEGADADPQKVIDELSIILRNLGC
ncbi:OLC1v1022591C1 [Oldenlandia corymbosa var. corymbosa]|uniref:OLC1v1022591C1 n=1 Tax=Oldenlandia corymbosa var. corymbosa TaxID=529605 RepID=A0AAV1BZL0_OLDCO|nr:OLC1v1022591C1 [Oldenlandia corymbosa var. corymbosa]